MNECLLVDIIGELSPEIFENDKIESDVDETLCKIEKSFIRSRAAKVLVGVTAGSLVATAGIILAVRLHKNNYKLSLIQK